MIFICCCILAAMIQPIRHIELAEAAQHMSYDLRAISVPKTIDNDLPYTDHCPGYGSAARFMALATHQFRP